MKTFLKNFAMLAVLPLLAITCDKSDVDDPDTPDTPTEFEAPVVSTSSDNVVIDLDRADETALTISWTAAAESGVKYDLLIVKENQDAFAADGFRLTETDVLKHDFTNNELQEMLETKFEAKSGETVALKAVVYATSVDDDSIDGVTSEETKFSVTSDIQQIVFPDKLYMKGGATPGGWDTATILSGGGAEGIYTAENVELRFGKLEDGKGFKFFVDPVEGYPFYGQSTALDAQFGDVALFASENDGDSQFYPLKADYKSGVYSIGIDLNALKLTLTKTGDVDEFDPEAHIYIVGNNMEHGWDLSEATALAPVAGQTDVFEGHDIMLKKDCNFKFARYNWAKEYIRDAAASNYWTLTERGTDDTMFVPADADADFKAGKYTVRVDLNAKSVTLTLTEATEAQPDPIYIMGDTGGAENTGSTLNWDFKAENELAWIAENVYEGTFYLVPEDRFKFTLDKNWSGAVRDINAAEYWTLCKDGSDNRFVPKEADPSFVAGNYVVNVNLNTNKVTLTKVE